MKEKTKIVLISCGLGFLLIEALMFVLISFCVVLDFPVTWPTGIMKIIYLMLVAIMAVWSFCSVWLMKKYIQVKVVE